MKKRISIILAMILIIGVAATFAEEMVWVATSGKGKKYHYEDCRTLKGGKKAIPISEAKRKAIEISKGV